MNQVFCDIDYKRPVATKDDFRTSTYRGHRYIDDTMCNMKLNVKYPEKKIYREDPILARLMVSEHQDHYKWQYGDPDAIRNPALGQKVQFIKPYSEYMNHFLQRPMKPAQSVTQQCFTRQIPEPEITLMPISMPSAIKVDAQVIDRSQHSYSKYLDPSATTSRLDYVPRTPEQIMGGIAAHDNITFWNWAKMYNPLKPVVREREAQQCDRFPAKDCVKRRGEFPNLVKPVPNTGMTTEVRQNYVEPYKCSEDFDSSQIQNCIPYVPIQPFAKNTEAKIIGSGDRVQKFV